MPSLKRIVFPHQQRTPDGRRRFWEFCEHCDRLGLKLVASDDDGSPALMRCSRLIFEDYPARSMSRTTNVWVVDDMNAPMRTSKDLPKIAEYQVSNPEEAAIHTILEHTFLDAAFGCWSNEYGAERLIAAYRALTTHEQPSAPEPAPT